MRARTVFSILVILLLSLSAAVRAAEQLKAVPGFAAGKEGIVAAVELRFSGEYHAYAHNPGGTGRPTTLGLRAGGEDARILYPAGSMTRDYYDRDAVIHVYGDGTRIFALLPASAAGASYEGEVGALLCSARRCLPVTASFSGKIPASPPPLARMPWRGEWEALAAEAAAASAPGGDAAAGGREGADAASGDGLPALSPRPLDESLEVSSLGMALALGLLAGLLLNVMPCVLPVLTFKIGGMLLMGEGREGLRRFQEHSAFFALGILTLFTILALILGGADLMWGQLYQSQGVLLGMLTLIFLMGLSMLGVFTLPIIDPRIGTGGGSPRLKAYLGGLVATFLATPCSGPLLGGVLGWAFTQPMLTLMAVFWAVGVGMALPHLLFAVWPRLAAILPRPGAWMTIFERVMGFCLLGTALYLLSILPEGMHLRVLAVLLPASMAAWFWGRFCGMRMGAAWRGLVGAACLGLLVLGMTWVTRPLAPMPQWRPFTEEMFLNSLGREPMLLEFTADWCPNCKFLEATVLTAERLDRWKRRHGMSLIRVDLTAPNEFASRLCEALGSRSIPVTALFPAGAEARSPVVLRDVYGVGDLERAMRRAFGPAARPAAR